MWKLVRGYIWLVPMVLAVACPAKKDHITIGLNPNENKEGVEALATELSTRAGVKIEFRKAASYSELVSNFKKGELQFAFFSPLNFLQAERDAGAKVLLKKVYGNSEFYYSAILVNKKSK